MKAVLLASTFLVGFAGAAAAADLVIDQAPVIEAAAAAHDWAGAYFGAAVGFTSLTAEDLTYGPGPVSGTGVSGALYAGYNVQFDSFVLGVEGDVAVSSASVDDGDYLLPLSPVVTGSIRGRAGVALDQIMPYVTAGIAIGRFEADHEGLGDPADFAHSTLTGYVVGGGVELAVAENLVVRAEYLFSNYGTHDFDFYAGDIHEVDVQSHDIRVGIAYQF